MVTLERRREIRRNWAARNRDYARAYYLKNREKLIAASTKRNSDKPDAHRAANAKWREKNPGHTTEWHRRNPEMSSAISRNRRARKNMADGSFSAREWASVVEAYGGVCSRCRGAGTMTADHIIPLSKGGSNGIGNIQPLCRSCNASKGVRTIWFRPYMRTA